MKLIHKFLDTSNLSKLNGKSQRIDWKNCIGKSVYFEYDDLKGYIKIFIKKRTQFNTKSIITTV